MPPSILSMLQTAKRRIAQPWNRLRAARRMETFTQPRTAQSICAGLAVLVLVAGVLGVPQSGSAAVVSDAHALLEVCGKSPLGLVPCAQDKLEAVLLTKGSESAYQILENASAQDPAMEAEGHNVAHQLGRTSVSYYPTSKEALRHCPLTMASGCFHGVLERHFTNVGPPRQAGDLTQLCTQDDGANRYFQCLHGLGHGLDMVAMHELPQALAWCSLLSLNWTQDSCAGGVFMENIVADTSMEHHHGMAMPNMTWVRLKADDLQYPCDAVSQRWWRDCYWLQSSAVLRLGKTMQDAFTACDAAPNGYQDVCYESMGRDISGTNHREASAIVNACMGGQFTLRGSCIYGAAQEIVNNSGKTAPGFTFCSQVPLRQKTDCYRAMGAMVRNLAPTDRQRECQRSESKYVQVCLKAAA